MPAIDLNSPWDLALKTGILIVAMAGPHQIWVIDLLHDQAYPYAGTGEEARRDGAVNEAAFAQPSGLAHRSATRSLSRTPSPTPFARCSCRRRITVTTMAGGDLFEFGDQDGAGDARAAAASARRRRARRPRVHRRYLQPQDQDARSRFGKVTTFAGTGQPGHVDGAASRAQFYEPGGLSVAGNTLYVADTNNHAVRTVDLARRNGRDADH